VACPHCIFNHSPQRLVSRSLWSLGRHGTVQLREAWSNSCTQTNQPTVWFSWVGYTSQPITSWPILQSDNLVSTFLVGRGVNCVLSTWSFLHRPMPLVELQIYTGEAWRRRRLTNVDVEWVVRTVLCQFFCRFIAKEACNFDFSWSL